MRKKIWLILAIVMALALSLSACGVNTSTKNTSSPSSGNNAADSAAENNGTGTAEDNVSNTTENGGSSIVEGNGTGAAENNVGPVNADGSIDLAITPNEASGFVCSSPDVGFFIVNLPEGAFGTDAELSVTQVTTSLDGVIVPGFTVTDKANPGAHVELSEPATITFYSKDTLPDDVTIVKYSDDMTSYSAAPSIGVETDQGYLIMAEVDGFSGYGLAAMSIGAKFQGSSGYIWRMEAEDHTTRIKEEGAESIDMAFYMRADSQRYMSTTGVLTVPQVYRGLFDVQIFTVSSDKADFGGSVMPLLIRQHLSDQDLKITMIPKIKKASEAAWEKFRDDLYHWALDALAAYEADQAAEEDGLALRPLMREKSPPTPPPDIVDGYIGWGAAHLTFDEVFEGLGGADIVIDVPIVVRSADGVNLTVSFSYMGLVGEAEIKGIFKGVGVADAAAPPELFDVSMDYSPDKPFEQPPEPEGDPTADVVVADSLWNTKIDLPGGGWIRLIQLFTEDDKDKDQPQTIDDFLALWSSYADNQYGY